VVIDADEEAELKLEEEDKIMLSEPLCRSLNLATIYLNKKNEFCM